MELPQTNPPPPLGAISTSGPFSAEISSAASMAGIPVDIATRLVQQESSFNPRAKSPVGAMGLTQLMPDTAKMLGVTDPYNPADNLAGGFKYLASLKQQFGNWDHALAAYNWGPGNVGAWIKSGADPAHLPTETREYIAKIAPQQAAPKKKSRLEFLGRRTPPPPAGAVPIGKTDQKLPPPPSGATPIKAGPRPSPIPPIQTFTNPMDTADGGGNQLQDTTSAYTQSALSTVAGRFDLPFILHNAQLEDADQHTGEAPSVISLLRNPNSRVSQAWRLYMSNPGAAMDQYGVNSPAYHKYMSTHFPESNEGRFSSLMLQNPGLNGILTFFEEQGNPLSAALGLGLGTAGDAIGGTKAAQTAGQFAADKSGFGSPLYDIRNRGGVEGSQWAKGLIARVKRPQHESQQVAEQIYGGLTNGEQREVWRISQGLKPNPTYIKQYKDLKARADLVRADIKHVTNEKLRTGVLDKSNVHDPNTYLPMSGVYDFGPQFELEQQLAGGSSQTSSLRPKTFNNYDESLASGMLDPNFSPAQQHMMWRRQGLQRVAFEDAMADAPASLRRDISPQDVWHPQAGPRSSVPVKQPGESDTDALIRFAKGTKGYQIGPSVPVTRTEDVTASQPMMRVNPKDPDGPLIPAKRAAQTQSRTVTTWEADPNTTWAKAQEPISPQLKKSMLAPELWEFISNNGGLRKYIDANGSWLPGEQNTWGGRLISLARNAMLSNRLWHPMVNVAGNDAAARGLYNLGGPTFEAGGYGYNAAKAIALQTGLKKPEDFVGGAQQYATWVDRGLKAGAEAEFGVSPKSAMGGDRARVLTENNGPIMQRLVKALHGDTQPLRQGVDRAFTRLSNWNFDGTFRSKGEQAYAVSLFKDAVERGHMSDAEAGEVVRESLGDYYNFDPRSPWSAMFNFMPWLKGNTKFWINVLARKPAYVAGTVHAARNYNISQNAPELTAPYPGSDFMVHKQGLPPLSFPFVGRDLSRLANAAGDLPTDLNSSLGNVSDMMLSRGNALTRLGIDTIQTAANRFNKDEAGPETNPNLLMSNKAPAQVQLQQLAKSLVAQTVPVPLIGYAIQDAARKGTTPKELALAFAGSLGAGYFGNEPLTDDQRREVSRAQTTYKKLYYAWRDDPDHNNQDLLDAWDDYMSSLRDAGVIH